MLAKPRRSAEANTDPVTAPVSDDADQLRALVSAMLSGTYKEEFYLWDVASLCRAKPEFARQLLALIDRYHRLGQMSAAQHKKIKDKIEQTVALRAAPLSRSRTSDAPTRANTTSPLAAADAAAEQRASAAPAAPAGAVASAQSAQSVPSVPSAVPAAAAAASNAGAAADADTDIDADTADAPTAAAVAALAATRPVSPFGRAAQPAGGATPPAQMTAAEVMAAAQAMEAVLAAPPPLAQPAAAPRPAVIAPGTVLRERYELQALIGSGGMGSVYRALDRYRVSLGLPDSCVALKIVTAHPLGAASVLALGREFHNAQQLSHPSVVNVYEIDHEGDASFYTMELLDGERLSQLLDRIGGPLPTRYALAIIRDIGAAIAHAHSRGVVHGDLKPHNIFITYGGQVRVLDFGGLSHSPAEPWISDDTSTRRSSSYRTATPAYASCEQLDGHRAEPRDDIYAIACIAYELLTGNHPFDCTSSAQARAQRLRPARPPGLRAERWRALRQGLAWNRAQRPDRIEPWLDQLGVAEAAAHLPPTHQLTTGAPRGSAIGRAVLAAVLLLALGCAVFGIELHGGVDWRQVMTTAQSKWQNTWQQWRSAAGGSPAITAPANAGPATVTPAAGAAVPGAADKATPDGAAAGAAADSGVPHPLSLPPDRTQPGTVRARPRVASTAARLAALREAGSATEARARGSVAATESVAAGATADVAGTAGAASPASAGGTADAGTAPSGPAIGVQFTAPSYDVVDTAPAARVVVRRTGSADKDIRFVWWTVEDSAKADVDYAPLGVRTEVIPSGADNITIYIPIISNPLRHQTASFYVALGAPGTGRSETSAQRASVTIERGG